MFRKQLNEENDEFLKQIYKKVVFILVIMYALAFGVVYMDQNPNFKLPALEFKPRVNFTRAIEEVEEIFGSVTLGRLRAHKDPDSPVT
mmetsp:Transcript_3512/g.3463  ORF Transcript_3512/g.3463 Transcript_3512/m.3463 type:complete len:88 (-) Transcript_3512:274-537(-)